MIKYVYVIFDLMRHSYFFSSQLASSNTKKLWGEDDMAHKAAVAAAAAAEQQAKGIFPANNPWATRDDTWGNAPSGAYESWWSSFLILSFPLPEEIISKFETIKWLNLVSVVLTCVISLVIFMVYFLYEFVLNRGFTFDIQNEWSSASCKFITWSQKMVTENGFEMISYC